MTVNTVIPPLERIQHIASLGFEWGEGNGT